MNDCPAGMEVDTQCINTIRTLSMDAIQKANLASRCARRTSPGGYVLDPVSETQPRTPLAGLTVCAVRRPCVHAALQLALSQRLRPES
ncbi:MAG: hypothetical protein R2860_11610 [Desulfobacterales bacterium]